ncbi:hypothetical protein J0H33_01800 [bacterium]|nr:hypothetical protein [bacterium]
MKAKALLPLSAAAIAVALLSLGAAPAIAASAQARARRTPPSVEQQFTLEGTNGFSVSVKVRNRRRLTLSASKGSLFSSSQARYELLAPQAPGSDEIVARLGRLGRIDVRFVPKSVKEAKYLPDHCRGDKTIIEQGRFVGRIAFRGERGFTRVHAAGATGLVTKIPPRICHTPASQAKKERRQKAAAKRAKEELAGGGGTFQEIALGVRTGRKAGFIAVRLAIQEKKNTKKSFSMSSFVVGARIHRGKIKELSTATDLLEPGSNFKVTDPQHPTAGAVIEPPPPFSGSATFSRESAHQVSWTGDLRVELPAVGDLRLTGPGTHAWMCELQDCKAGE